MLDKTRIDSLLEYDLINIDQSIRQQACRTIVIEFQDANIYEDVASKLIELISKAQEQLYALSKDESILLDYLKVLTFATEVS
jgi:hypothetical protein